MDKVWEIFWRDDAHLDTGLVQLRLGPGMVLLRKFLSQNDQIAIIKLCRDLGVGPGGFYQLSRRDAELGLQMMSLGKSWNSEASKYEERCSIDGAEPPRIPDLFKKLVKTAMQASHDLIKQKTEGRAEDELPELSPDICIVDYYSNTGRLCLRQDKYESKDSICKALPVVTFSIGDTADFLNGDHGEDAAKHIMLESGDVLVYGGRSRFIHHRISKIYQDTSPKRLIEETNLRPGHLSLTFKQY